MPLYEYQCERCDHRFEVIQKFSDPLVAVCPVCGGPVRKLMSSPAIQFKGTGWYVTDYARKGGDTKTAKDAKDAKDAKGANESDSKDAKESKETKTESATKTETSSSSSTPASTSTKKTDS